MIKHYRFGKHHFLNFSFVLEEQVDGEALFYMNDINLLKSFKLSYKHQIMFLREGEQLFLSKTNQEQQKSAPSSTSDKSSLLVIDENFSETLEIENELRHSPESFSINTTITDTKSLEAKPFPDPYILPSLPSQVNDAITL